MNMIDRTKETDRFTASFQQGQHINVGFTSRVFKTETKEIKSLPGLAFCNLMSNSAPVWSMLFNRKFETSNNNFRDTINHTVYFLLGTFNLMQVKTNHFTIFNSFSE